MVKLNVFLVVVSIRLFAETKISGLLQTFAGRQSQRMSTLVDATSFQYLIYQIINLES